MLYIIFLVVAVLISLILLLWQLSLLYVAVFGSPTVYANSQAIRDSLKLAKLKAGESIVDFGCGNANTLIIASREFGARGVGVEISPWCYIKAWWNVIVNGQVGRVKIVFGDFKKAEEYLKKADVVYLYLLNETLKKFESWYFKSISQKTRTVSLAFWFPSKKPLKTVSTFNLRKDTKIYLYKK